MKDLFAKVMITRTATRSRRRPGNPHFISFRQVSAHAATLRRYAAAAAAAAVVVLLNADAALNSSLIRPPGTVVPDGLMFYP